MRVMLTDVDLPSAGVTNFYPCEDCPEPCRTVCPQDAFAEQIYSEKEYGIKELPGRNGVYDRLRCNQQMIICKSKAEEISAADNQETPKKLIKYCRECELVCPIGSK